MVDVDDFGWVDLEQLCLITLYGTTSKYYKSIEYDNNLLVESSTTSKIVGCGTVELLSSGKTRF